MYSYCGSCGEPFCGDDDREAHECPGPPLCATPGCTREAQEPTGSAGRHCDDCHAAELAASVRRWAWGERAKTLTAHDLLISTRRHFDGAVTSASFALVLPRGGLLTPAPAPQTLGEAREALRRLLPVYPAARIVVDGLLGRDPVRWMLRRADWRVLSRIPT